MLIVNNKALKITNKWLNPVAGSGPTPPGPTPPTYYHVYTSATNGTITATPVSGISGTTVTLSNTPDTGYEFDSYSLTGATLYDTNKFDINNSDVNVVGNFIAAAPVYINPDYINHRDYYAGWYKSQLSNKGGTYNSTYKVITDNWPAGWNINQFYCTFYYSDWTIIDYAYCAKASDNYEFNISNYLTQTQYNDLYYLTLNPADSDYNLLQTISDDIKLQLLS